MKKNIKGFAILLAIVIICTVFTACRGDDTTDTENTTTAASTTTEEITSTEPISINMGELINSEAKGKPIVEISCGGISLSYDLSEYEASEVEVTIHEELEEDHFYVTMAGEVTAHTLMSDGSLFDGIAYIENGKAQFSITYNDERTITFIINVAA